MAEDWKEWHRRLSDILGCEYLERTVTLERAQEIMDELDRLREGAQETADDVENCRDLTRSSLVKRLRALSGGSDLRQRIRAKIQQKALAASQAEIMGDHESAQRLRNAARELRELIGEE